MVIRNAEAVRTNADATWLDAGDELRRDEWKFRQMLLRLVAKGLVPDERAELPPLPPAPRRARPRS